MAFELLTSQPDITPPVMVSAVSRATHGAGGPSPSTWDINLVLAPPAAASVEPRENQPSKVIVTFSEPVNPGLVTLTNATLAGVVPGSPGANDVTINMTGAITDSCVKIVMTGVTDMAGNALAGDNDIHIRCHWGDADLNTFVNVNDMNAIRANISPPPLTAANFQYDVDINGFINVNDMNTARMYIPNGSCACP